MIRIDLIFQSVELIFPSVWWQTLSKATLWKLPDLQNENKTFVKSYWIFPSIIGQTREAQNLPNFSVNIIIEWPKSQNANLF